MERAPPAAAIAAAIATATRASATAIPQDVSETSRELRGAKGCLSREAPQARRDPMCRALFSIGHPAFYICGLGFHSRVMLCDSMTGCFRGAAPPVPSTAAGTEPAALSRWAATTATTSPSTSAGSCARCPPWTRAWRAKPYPHISTRTRRYLSRLIDGVPKDREAGEDPQPSGAGGRRSPPCPVSCPVQEGNCTTPRRRR